MKRKLMASVLMLATALFGLGGTANALPHVMFRDSDKWVAGPRDITASGAYSWALPEMADATAWEIIDGYPGGVTSDGYTIAPEFRPEKEITRAEYAKVLAVTAGLADDAGAASVPFTDVSSADWFFAYVSALYKQGVIRDGDRAGTAFSPNQAITRLDMALWAGRAAVAYGVQAPAADLSGFADGASVPVQFREELATSVGLGIIKGSTVADGSIYLYPSGTAKRVEATAMVVRMLARFDQHTASMSTLESTVRHGLRSFMDQGKVVLTHHNPPHSFGHKYVEGNQAAVRLALAPYFSAAMLTLVRDTREQYLPYNIGGGYLTWNAWGYTTMNDLSRWGSLGLDYRTTEITSVAPVRLLDRYAVVSVSVDVRRAFPNGMMWDQEQVFNLHLKKLGGRWVITQRTFISEIRTGVVAP